jgi:ABC-2 type transport system ATP-binding protein
VSATEVAETVRFVGLSERIDDRVHQYSHGMRRRLALAQALLPRPDLLLLDEWENGLDPEGRHELREMLVRLNRDHGVTVVMSSHHPSGLHGMCDRLAVLRQGRIVSVGPWTGPIDGPPVVMLDLDDWERARPVLAALGASRSAGDRVVLAPSCDVADVVAALVRAEVRVRGVRVADAGSAALSLHGFAEEAVELRDAAAVGVARR